MTLAEIAPRLSRAHAAEKALLWRGISRCWQNNGYHVYGAGPCFDTLEQAIRYREAQDRAQVTCPKGGTHVRRHHADVGECLKCGRWSVALHPERWLDAPLTETENS